MVYLSKIYTRSGDGGTTGLGDGSRVNKADLRIMAIGDVDELNASLGLFVSENHAEYWGRAAGQRLVDEVRAIQNDLFDLGADLCVPEGSGEDRLRVTQHQVGRLETQIDRMNEALTPLTSFILPGGTPTAAVLHVARTVCRRAERSVILLADRSGVNPAVICYLNRLSDYLFVAARCVNRLIAQSRALAAGLSEEKAENLDVLWVPGKSA
jgi:cob(I)alamin adenosyltransferase